MSPQMAPQQQQMAANYNPPTFHRNQSPLMPDAQGSGEFGANVPTGTPRMRSMGYGPGPHEPQWGAKSPSFANMNTAQFQPIVELISYQPHKTYVASPPELEMIFARTSAGQTPK